MSYLINLFVEVKVKKDLADESKEVLFKKIYLILIYIFIITFYLLFINYIIFFL